MEETSTEDIQETDAAHELEEELVEQTMSLNEQRLGSVLAALRACNARSVIDLGCGEGKLLQALLSDRSFERIAGLDVSFTVLERARSRLRWESLSDLQKSRIEILHGSLLYRDPRLDAYDAAALVEVIEHFDPPRIAAFERAIFEQSRPRALVLTTPNFEYNVKFPAMPSGGLRHRDHRFEWTRAELQAWASGVAARFGYRVRFLSVGAELPDVGPPTQMAVFER
jgi:3' terminal RNA ribose 2'-O-methyltransferase Hen1